MARAAIFDLDGTLVDTRSDLAAAVNHARGEMGFDPLPQQEIVGYVGEGMTRLLARSFHGRVDLVETARPFFMSHYAEHLLDNSPLYPGVSEGIERLASRGAPMSALTNKPEAFARRMLERYGLARCLIDVVGGDTFPTQKPDPAGALALLEKMDATAAETFMVGDNHTDLRTAAACGMPAVYCDYGFGSLDGLTPDRRVAAFSEIVQLIQPSAT